ncbi:hypothetical protein IWQ61_005369 [Dispira simplex]|nr:hypothetical protein IWQ61_005369 [Dispira simplex]
MTTEESIPPTTTITRESPRPYDIIVWGATGFTGQKVAEYLLRQAPPSVKLCLGGRSQTKLEHVRTLLKDKYPRVADLPLVVGNSTDEESMARVAQQTRVILSTVGPFALYGEPLVKACAQYGTDYVDITGEVGWVNLMAHRYHTLAQQNQALIVSCCGFDSIPSDLGTYMVTQFIKQRYGKETEVVKGSMVKLKGGVSGGTLASVIETIGNPISKPPTTSSAGSQESTTAASSSSTRASSTGTRFPVYFDADFNQWQGPFLMALSNVAVVRNSHRNLHYGRDFSYKETSSYRSWWASSKATLGLLALYLLLKFSATRWLLMKYLPAPGQGPRDEDIAKGCFTYQVVGNAATQTDEPTLRAYGMVEGKSDPGYGETIIYVAEAALCLLLNRTKVRSSGGVLSPAAAMGDALLERYRTHGLTFSVGSEPFIKAKL